MQSKMTSLLKCQGRGQLILLSHDVIHQRPSRCDAKHCLCLAAVHLLELAVLPELPHHLGPVRLVQPQLTALSHQGPHHVPAVLHGLLCSGQLMYTIH